MTQPAEIPADELGRTLEERQIYVRLWQWRARLEYIMLALIAVFAISIAAGFIIFSIGVDDVRRWGYPGLWVISLLRACSVLLPIPGSGITFAAGAFMNPVMGVPGPLVVGLVAGSAESIGECVGYFAGRNGATMIETRRFYKVVAKWIRRRAFLTVLFFAMLPSLAFDVAGLAAGASKVPMRIFYPALLIGKIIRGTAMAYAGFYGVELFNKIF